MNNICGYYKFGQCNLAKKPCETVPLEECRRLCKLNQVIKK